MDFNIAKIIITQIVCKSQKKKKNHTKFGTKAKILNTIFNVHNIFVGCPANSRRCFKIKI